MIIYYGDYKLAAGWNNAGSLATIESILAIEGVHPFPFGTYTPGIKKPRPNAPAYIAGKPSCKWPFTVIPTQAKHYTLMTTYCAGGYEGKVTVRTRTDDSANYANFNAIMILPFLPEVKTESQRFEDYTIQFVKMVAI